MKVPGLKTAKTVQRWVSARLLGGALILGYHRIADESGDVYKVCVSPENFAKHLDVLRKYTKPIRLSELVQQLNAGRLSPRSVAVTFDDGYANTLYEAKPLLEQYEIPATVFVCTGNLGREFWWDELERLVISSTADLHALDQEMRKSPFHRQPLTGKSEVPSSGDPSHRAKFRDALYHFLLTLDVDEQEQAMQIVRNWSGLSRQDRLARRALNADELIQLADGDLVELGAHTRNHPMLPRLSPDRQREEITSGKRDLETILGRPVAGFSYPNGQATQVAKRIVCETGFAYACTSMQDMVRTGSDIYDLTRFWQKDVDGDAFLQTLNLWMR